MSKDLKDALINLSKRSVDTFVANVVFIDKVKGVCTVEDGKLNYSGVKLSAVVNGEGNKFYLFPKVGSVILVSPIHEDIKNLYVEAFSEIEEVNISVGDQNFKMTGAGFVINNGLNGGLVKVDALLSKINALETSFNTLKQILSAWVPVPGDGGLVLKTAITAWAAQMMLSTQKTELENKQFKH